MQGKISLHARGCAANPASRPFFPSANIRCHSQDHRENVWEYLLSLPEYRLARSQHAARHIPPTAVYRMQHHPGAAPDQQASKLSGQMKMRILLRVMRRTSYGLGNAGNIAWDKIAKGWLRRLRICDPAASARAIFPGRVVSRLLGKRTCPGGVRRDLKKTGFR